MTMVTMDPADKAMTYAAAQAIFCTTVLAVRYGRRDDDGRIGLCHIHSGPGQQCPSTNEVHRLLN
jgi:hypothetical protein